MTDIRQHEDVLTAALAYAARGWHIFPTDGKQPMVVGKQPDGKPARLKWSSASTTDPEQIIAWYAGSSGLGIGVDLKKSGLMAVDVDRTDQFDDDLKTLVGTPWRLQGNPARMAMLYQLNGHDVSRMRGSFPWGETRVTHYIVLPPSPHPDGFTYRWIPTPADPADPGHLPEPLYRRLLKSEPARTPAAPPPAVVTDADKQKALDRLWHLCDKVAQTPEGGGEWGGRNQALNAVSLIVGHYVPHLIDESVARQALERAADACGLVRDDGLDSAQATIASGLSAGMREPQHIVSTTPSAASLLGLDATTPPSGREGADGPPAAPEAPPEPLVLPDDFWEASTVLRHIRQAAYHHQLAPAALLGATLARASMLTPFDTELPAKPNRGSLNLFIGVVGASGAGKGSSVSVASRLLPAEPSACRCGESRNDEHRGDYLTISPGSGEGLLRAFYDSVPNDTGKGTTLKRDRSQVLLDVDEIETLIATMGRSGATIGPVLRSLWSGTNAGFENASAERRFPLSEGTYRVSMVAGVQPGVVAKLFDEAQGGTPQRFVWMPTDGTGIPNLEEGEVLPDWPGTLAPIRPSDRGEPWRPRTLDIASAVQTEIELRRNRVKRGAEVLHELDAHRDFNRLRVAALLAILHEDDLVDETYWGMAGEVMDLSDRTRAAMLSTVSRTQARRAASKGRMAAIEESGKAQAVEEAVERVCERLANRVHLAGGMARAKARRDLASRDRPYFDDALQHAIGLGWIVEEESPNTNGGGGTLLNPGESRPA